MVKVKSFVTQLAVWHLQMFLTETFNIQIFLPLTIKLSTKKKEREREREN